MELANCGSDRPMSISTKEISIEERLINRKMSLESDLEDVNNALEALQKNPEILKVMCLISKVRY